MPSVYDIVLIPFPFTDLSSVKLRPAVVVANPYGDDIIVSFISSRNIGTANVNDVKVVASGENGLKKNSTIKCSKLATLDQKMLVGKLGTLEKKYQKTIQGKFKKIFNE